MVALPGTADNDPAVDEIEQLRGGLAHEAVRTSFLQDKIAAYEDLVRLYLDRRDEESVQYAFAVAERAKSRTLVDLLTGVIETKPLVPDPSLSNRLQSLQADLNAVYNELAVPDRLIPAVASEARAVADILPAADLRVDAQATVGDFRAVASGYEILHLACHGQFRADNPMFSALKLSDGWLTATDVLGLDLASALVVLSACESGRSQVVGGDEILGLARAFPGADAATLVVSQWLVQDDTTAQLMATWYPHLNEHVAARWSSLLPATLAPMSLSIRPPTNARSE